MTTIAGRSANVCEHRYSIYTQECGAFEYQKKMRLHVVISTTVES